MKYCFILLLLLTGEKKIIGQTFFTGLGYLECLHTGIELPISTRKTLEFSAGIQPFQWKDQHTFSISAGIFTRNKLKESSKKIIPISYGVRSTLWNFENKFNHFVNLSIAPLIRYDLYISKNSGIRLSGGYAFNNVIFYKRKTFTEVGWPRNWLPSFALSWTYSY